VVTRYYRELLSFLSRKVSDRATAADLAQESYARMYASQQTGSVVHDARALLYKTARNLVIDQGRRGAVRARFAEPDDDAVSDEADNSLGPAAFEPDVALQSQQMVNALLATIDGLPPRCRQAFILHKFDGLAHAEVAARMGVSVKMVEQHIRHALDACRRCREQADGDAPPVPPLRRRKGKRE
jgi:RNA polymerase sigma-70 factor (ECF subfamily)